MGIIKDFGKLAKLQIEPIKPKSGKPFVVMFNPESYSETFFNVYRDKKTINSGVEDREYAKTQPREFKLKIIIDGTGVSDNNSAFFGELTSTESVHQKVEAFKNMAWKPQKGQAPLLKISWGDFSFNGVLKEVTINYTLFDRDGDPLRAELDANFIGDPEELKQEVEKADQNSDTSKITGQTKGQTKGKSMDESQKRTANGIVINAS